ncbi:hypothetical protein RvY_13579 [Ramazzottius varieornatus]|uniref:Uncharacterized protein n=1 Tax=Ramazzottius varieornatus TaxID=947166 RepID=A0A1D1VWV7_RAMVA|nr:hypothetical protein RvY_13579 [Ramazzottius varieornatus]
MFVEMPTEQRFLWRAWTKMGTWLSCCFSETNPAKRAHDPQQLRPPNSYVLANKLSVDRPVLLK